MKILTALVALLVLFLPAMSASGKGKRTEFALYLFPPSTTSKGHLDLDLQKLKRPAGAPLISMADVSFYQKDRHELGLWYPAGLKLKRIARDLDGKRFVVFVGDAPIYAGVFSSSPSSQSFDGLVIEIGNLDSDFPILKIRQAYPTGKFAGTVDSRSDSRLLKIFERDGLLRQELFIRGKCQAMRATLKRRASTIFTFSVASVVKGNYPYSVITFEAWADGEDAKLLDALDVKARAHDDNWDFDRDKEVLLKFEQRTDLTKQPYWFWFSNFEIISK
ncbi:MAG TPA: hypothetical protein VLL54_19025 [Pyrinomonadaceae bacterium]|nr:hypothetical protein [Pyrinomonadaceae bacterium]